MPAPRNAHQAELLTRMAKQERELASEWVKKVVLALTAGNEALARQAMQSSLEHVETAARHDQELAHLEGRPSPNPVATADVEGALNDLRRKMGFARHIAVQHVQPHGLEDLINALLAVDPKNPREN